ncbi:MFS transporter [Streptomyces sp. NPDC000594]|uniref:MFS transporter n=1 Tax=Streptomyces sp. NPDC000594 TaxID=3154261 RepID=UPI00331FDBE8
METRQPPARGTGDEPWERVRPGWTLRLILVHIGLYMAFLTPIQLLLAQQLDGIDPGNKEAALSWATGIGALIAVVANPVAGALSDRTRSRYGRRRPWIAGGTALASAGLVLTSVQSSVAGVTAGWCLAQLGLNAVLASAVAVVPDRVPVAQRASVTGWVGLAQPLGLVAGAALVTVVGTGPAGGYLLLTSLTVLLVLPFLLVREVPGAPVDRVRLRARDFWVDPRAHPDFGWSWLTRFAVNLGNGLGTLYMLYFLDDTVGHPAPDQGVLVLTALYTGGVTVTAIGAGRVSDRLGLRRAPVALGATVMSVAALLLAAHPTWPVTMVAATLLGLGFGAYVGVEQALLTQVLPRAGDRAKDLGVLNVANAVPQVLGPALAASVIALGGGYSGLFITSALLTGAGAALVWRIRSVR